MPLKNNKVVLADGTVLIDITDTTATANDVAEGKVFYGANGVRSLGTYTEPSSDKIIFNNEYYKNLDKGMNIAYGTLPYFVSSNIKVVEIENIGCFSISQTSTSPNVNIVDLKDAWNEMADRLDAIVFKGHSSTGFAGQSLKMILDSRSSSTIFRLPNIVIEFDDEVYPLQLATTTYISNVVFSGNVYVPDALVNTYKTSTNWTIYASKIKPLSEYTGG